MNLQTLAAIELIKENINVYCRTGNQTNYGIAAGLREAIGLYQGQQTEAYRVAELIVSEGRKLRQETIFVKNSHHPLVLKNFDAGPCQKTLNDASKTRETSAVRYPSGNEMAQFGSLAYKR